MSEPTFPSGADRQEPSPVDDAPTRAFIAGWNARLDYSDFEMALHYWMLSQVRLPDADEGEAHLRAAAHDMYDALAAYVHAYDNGTGTIHVNAQVRAAMAKAHGIHPADANSGGRAVA